mgnify:CR=1 FL=1
MYQVAVFSAKAYDKTSFERNKPEGIQYQYFDCRLNSTSVAMAQGFDAICAFVNDDLSADVLRQLTTFGVQAITLRCAGFNNLDLNAAKANNIRVARVPSYSPEAVAEHAIALILTLNRKLHKAYNRTKEDNFSLDGLLGFNLHKKTVGIIGTGKIGLATARILNGFGCRLLAFDLNQTGEFTKLGGKYVEKEALFKQSAIISLHCPLNEHTFHMIDQEALSTMQDGVMLVNTSRGGLIDSQCLIQHLKTGKIGHLALDVYEQESELFFEDHSTTIVQDDVFQRLLTFPNVLISGHQGFFTQEALEQIANTSHSNLMAFSANKDCDNEL